MKYRILLFGLFLFTGLFSSESVFAQEEQTEAPAEDISESDLKILLSKKLKAGKKAKVKELFEEYGVDSLSGLIDKHPDKIAEAYHKAEGI